MTVLKQWNLITQDELINLARDEMNEIGNFIYIKKNNLYYINDSVNTWLDKSYTDSQSLAVSEITLSKTGWRIYLTSSFECVDC